MSLSDAIFSADGRYRYFLTRSWARGPAITWVMLNPSTADAEVNDPTIRRCLRYSAIWNFGRMNVVNLFAYRATDPIKLFHAEDPEGPENRWYITRTLRESDLVVAAWGANAATVFKRDLPRQRYHERVDHWVVQQAQVKKVPMLALGLTKDGVPRHPLYMPLGVEPIPWGEVQPEEVADESGTSPCRGDTFGGVGNAPVAVTGSSTPQALAQPGSSHDHDPGHDHHRSNDYDYSADHNDHGSNDHDHTADNDYDRLGWV